jgi:small subunit ribosomal protein S20
LPGFAFSCYDLLAFAIDKGDTGLPNINSAKKWARASEKRRKRNLAVKTSLKSSYKKAVDAPTKENVLAAASAHDKAAARGIIHKNKASRKKSRLAKRAAAATKK